MSSAHHMPIIRMNPGPSKPVAHRMVHSQRRPARVANRNAGPGGNCLECDFHGSALIRSEVPAPPIEAEAFRRLPCRDRALRERPGPGWRLKLLHKPPAEPRLEPHDAGLSSGKAKLRPAPPPEIGLGGKDRKRRSRVRRHSNAYGHAVGSRRHRFRVRSTWSRKAESSPIQKDSTSPSQPRSWSKGSLRSW